MLREASGTGAFVCCYFGACHFGGWLMGSPSRFLSGIRTENRSGTSGCVTVKSIGGATRATGPTYVGKRISVQVCGVLAVYQYVGVLSSGTYFISRQFPEPGSLWWTPYWPSVISPL